MKDRITLLAEAIGWKRHVRNTAHWTMADQAEVVGKYPIMGQVGEFRPDKNVADAMAVQDGILAIGAAEAIRYGDLLAAEIRTYYGTRFAEGAFAFMLANASVNLRFRAALKWAEGRRLLAKQSRKQSDSIGIQTKY